MLRGEAIPHAIAAAVVALEQLRYAREDALPQHIDVEARPGPGPGLGSSRALMLPEGGRLAA